MNDFQIISKLGEGAYSTVYKVKRLVDDKVYALKKVKLLNLSEKEKLNSLNEVRILASVKSNFVISYKEAFFDEKDSTLGIVMEYADKGDLYQEIVKHKKSAAFFEESEIWRIFIQLVKGLKALHDLKILHRDLKSANVFLFKDSSAKLGDLNVSKVARRGLGYTQTGTPYYASPEVWRDSPYNNKSDIWSLGCVLYEMITLKPPFRAENMEGLYNKVIKGQFNKIPERFSDDLFSIVKLLLKVNSEQRPNCEQILKNPIILKRIEYFKSFSKEDNIDEERALLQTIKIPKNLLSLSDKLPKSNYDNNDDNNDINNDINVDNNGLKKYNSFLQKKELNHSVSIPKIIMNNIINDDLPKINNNNNYYYYKINNNKNNLNKIQEEDDFINNNKINIDSNNNSDINSDRILKKIYNKNLKQNNLSIIHNNKYKFKNNSMDYDDKNFIVNMDKDNINNMNNKKINLIENYNNKNRVLMNKYSKLNLNNNKYRIYKLYAPYLFENNQFNNNKKFKNNNNNNNNILNKKLLNHYLINNISNYKSIAYLKNLEKYYENYNKLKKSNNNSFINNTNNIKININNNNIFNLKGKFINNNINNINKKIYEANRNHSLEQKNTLKLNKRKLSPIRIIINSLM